MITKITVKGARENNLKNVSFEIPKDKFIVFTGVSGSGKSTLVYEILYKALMKKFYSSKERVGKYDSIIIPPELDKVIMIDQSPIGKTPRSNPATYIGVFDDIRKLHRHFLYFLLLQTQPLSIIYL
jgi:excinuclease ABC subunit A